MAVSPTALQANNYAKEQKFLSDLYSVLEVNKEQECSRKMLAQITGADVSRMDFVLLALQRANAYSMRFEWHDPSNVKPGKRSFWTLNMSFDEAKVVLDKAQTAHTLMIKNRYRKTLDAAHIGRLPVYSIGDDMPKGIGIKAFSPAAKEPKALVEAARQYGPKVNAAKQAFAMLTSSGISVDEKTFFELTKVPQDERLEIVSLVLPYIEQLETQIKELKTARKEAAKVTA